MKRFGFLVGKLTISGLILFVTACNQGEKEGSLPSDVVKNPASAQGKGDTKGAIITFEESEFDFGKIKEGEIVNHTFVFKNTGDADLLVTNAKASCGCTIPEYDKSPVRPGGTGKISIRFDSKGRPGAVQKYVRVYANTDPNETELMFKAEVQ